MKLQILYDYIVGIECEEMDEVNEFKCPRSVMCKHVGRERYIILEKRHCKEERCQVLWGTMNGRIVSLEVKRDLRHTVIVTTITHAGDTSASNASQRSRVQEVEMSYVRSAYGENW